MSYPPSPLSTSAKINNIHTKEFFFNPHLLTPHPPSPPPLTLSTFIDIINILKEIFFLNFSLSFFLIIARYRLNNTKYVLKWSEKKRQQVPKFNKKPYPHCPTPPGLIHIFEINFWIIVIVKYFSKLFLTAVFCLAELLRQLCLVWLTSFESCVILGWFFLIFLLSGWMILTVLIYFAKLFNHICVTWFLYEDSFVLFSWFLLQTYGLWR